VNQKEKLTIKILALNARPLAYIVEGELRLGPVDAALDVMRDAIAGETKKRRKVRHDA
jgi:hypothetical protein